MEPQFSLNSRSGFERHFVPSGGLLGPFWVQLWAHFGVLFRSPAGKADFLENVLPPAWEHEFQGSEGSEIVQQAIKNVTENSFRRQVRLERLSGTIWEHFWLHFGPQKWPKSGPENERNFEANFERF